MTVMAILQEVDKCIRCNGCVIACKREWNMKQETVGEMKVAYDQRLAIKSQRRGDMGPFLRFSCWHCPDPPCAKRCPYKAITKRADGAVDVDFTLCNPNGCRNSLGQYPCQVDCQRGGYPKIGAGSDDYADPKAFKCTLCSSRAGADDPTVAFQNPPTSQHYASGYKSTLTGIGVDTTSVIPELEHSPMCVMTCPAKAMVWDTQANVMAYLRDPANGYTNIDGNGSIGWVGNGSVYWASKKELLAPPKADPYVEDHLGPLASSLFSSPLAKAAIVPTLLVGGLLALSARRTANEEEVSA